MFIPRSRFGYLYPDSFAVTNQSAFDVCVLKIVPELGFILVSIDAFGSFEPDFSEILESVISHYDRIGFAQDLVASHSSTAERHSSRFQYPEYLFECSSAIIPEEDRAAAHYEIEHVIRIGHFVYVSNDGHNLSGELFVCKIRS